MTNAQRPTDWPTPYCTLDLGDGRVVRVSLYGWCQGDEQHAANGDLTRDEGDLAWEVHGLWLNATSDGEAAVAGLRSRGWERADVERVA